MSPTEEVGWLIAIRTVMLGAGVVVIGQIVQRFVLEPIQDQRRSIGEVAAALLFLANVAHVADQRSKGLELQYSEDPLKSGGRLRELASRLQASLWTIPCYRLWAILGVIPKRVKVEQASKSLIGWSNSLFSGQPSLFRDHIARLLKLPQVNE